MDLCRGAAMSHWSQQAGVDSGQTRQCSGVELIIFSATIPDQSHIARMRHDHFVPQPGQLPAYPG